MVQYYGEGVEVPRCEAASPLVWAGDGISNEKACSPLRCDGKSNEKTSPPLFFDKKYNEKASHGARLLVQYARGKTGWNIALSCASSQNHPQAVLQKTPPQSRSLNRKTQMSRKTQEGAPRPNSSTTANITSRAQTWSTNSLTSTGMPRGGPSYLRRSYTHQASNIPASRTVMETSVAGCYTRDEYQCCQQSIILGIV